MSVMSQRYLFKVRKLTQDQYRALIGARLLRLLSRVDAREKKYMLETTRSPSKWPKWARQVWYGTHSGRPE